MMEEHEAKSIADSSGDGAARLYRRYTSTSALAGSDLQSTLAANEGYFRINFSRHLPSDRQARIVEIGCGYGKNLYAMKMLGYSRLTGIDFSEEQIELARSTLSTVDVHFANAIEWLSQTEEKFDCIVLIDVLEHLDLSTLVTLGEMLGKHLMPGGRVIVQVPNDLAPMNPLRHGDLTHIRAFTPQSMSQFFSNAGLTVAFMGDAVSKNVLKRFVWRGLVKPLMKLFFILVHGRYAYPLLFSANLIVVAEKP